MENLPSGLVDTGCYDLDFSCNLPKLTGHQGRVKCDTSATLHIYDYIYMIIYIYDYIYNMYDYVCMYTYIYIYIHIVSCPPKSIGKRPFDRMLAFSCAEEHDALHDPKLRAVVVL